MLLIPQHHCPIGPGADYRPVLSFHPGNGAGQHREVSTLVAHGLVNELSRGFLHNQAYQDVIIVLGSSKLLQGNQAALVQFYAAVHSQQLGQHIRKAKPAPDAAAHRGQIPELNSHNVPNRSCHSPLGILIQPRVQLQLPQGHHGADGKLLFGFFNGVQPQVAQVNGGLDAALAHLHPKHSADDSVSPALVQLIGLFQALNPNIVAYVHHGKFSLLDSCAYSFFLHYSMYLDFEKSQCYNFHTVLRKTPRRKVCRCYGSRDPDCICG